MYKGRIGDPMSPEQQLDRGKKIAQSLAQLTPEERAEIARKKKETREKNKEANKAAMEARKRRREAGAAGGRARQAAITPEERAEMTARSQQSRAIALQAFGEVSRPRPIKLPKTGKRADQQCYLKLLSKVEDGRGALGWDGVICRPGAWVTREELRPNSSFPPTPILVEHAGYIDASSHRSQKESLWILWRLEAGRWQEIGRTPATRDEWTIVLAPLARAALAQLQPQPEDKRVERLEATFASWRAWLEKQLGRMPDREEKCVMLSWLYQSVAGLWAASLPDYPGGGVVIEAAAVPPDPPPES